MSTKSAQEVVAKALWAEGNNRIGHRPWKDVGNTYMAEAGKAIAALTASGFTVGQFVVGIEGCDCDDRPWPNHYHREDV